MLRAPDQILLSLQSHIVRDVVSMSRGCGKTRYKGGPHTWSLSSETQGKTHSATRGHGGRNPLTSLSSPGSPRSCGRLARMFSPKFAALYGASLLMCASQAAGFAGAPCAPLAAAPRTAMSRVSTAVSFPVVSSCLQGHSTSLLSCARGMGMPVRVDVHHSVVRACLDAARP